MDFTPDRLDALKQLGFSPRTIIDCGAYNGAWAASVKRQFPDCYMFSVEANDQHEERLERRIAEKQIDEVVINRLLGDRTKSKVEFYCNVGENSGNSIYRELGGCFREGLYHIRQLEMTTLDTLLQERNLTNVDLIKLDVQGAERDVLEGAKNTL